MEDDKATQLNDLLEKLADQLNISKTKEERAVTAYEAVGNWLDEDCRIERGEIYAQGSFSLGTVVRPLSGDDDGYDIDLVYCMPDLAHAPSEMIKAIPGERLKENGTYREKLEPEGKRCWTLAYDGFHMDILPCTNDLSSQSDSAIRLTHREQDGSYSNRYSDPQSYAKWFEEQMGDTLEAAKMRYSGKVCCSVDDVKTYQVRTTLQKAVQVLKHHRNLMFEGDNDDAPISIIITTLAGQAYSGEDGVYDALRGILLRMERYVDHDGQIYRIMNPVDKKENFADKWNMNPNKARAFYKWLKRVREDLQNMERARGFRELHKALRDFAGETMATRVHRTYGEDLKSARSGGALYASAEGLLSGSAGGVAAVRVKEHAFYGKADS